MKTYRYNGERWHLDTRSIFVRLRQWVAWIGGWERASGAIDRSGPATPISLLGGRVVFYGHWFQVKTDEGYLVVKLKRTADGKATLRIDAAYISRFGTPDTAHVWLVGTPDIIVKHVATRAVA